MKNFILFLFAAVVGFSAVPLVSFAGAAFFVDSTTGYVGIGNTTPTAPLDISGAFYSHLVTLSTTTTTIDWNQGNVQKMTLSNSPTLVFNNGQDGGRYDLILSQDVIGDRTVSWPPSIKWAGGAPILTVEANSIDVMHFIYDGTSYLGSYTLNYVTPTDISFDNTATSTSSTFSYANNGNMLFACVYTNSGGLAPSVTYNGTSMTQIASIPFTSSGYDGIVMFELTNPSTGSHTVSISGSSYNGIALSSYAGAKISGQPDATTTDTFAASATSHTVSITTNINNDWIIGCNANNSGVANNVSDGSIRAQFNGAGSVPAGPLFDSNSSISPAGSFSSTINWSSNTGGADVVAAFSPQ